MVPPGDPIPGVFRKVHIGAQNYRWNFNFLSADILTNLNKISTKKNSAFFMNLCPTLSKPLRQGMLLNDISFKIIAW